MAKRQAGELVDSGGGGMTPFKIWKYVNTKMAHVRDHMIAVPSSLYDCCAVACCPLFDRHVFICSPPYGCIVLPSRW